MPRRWARLDPYEMKRLPDPMTTVPSAPEPADPVTVTVARRVAPGREGDFEDWAADIMRVAKRFPGFLGGGVLRPGEAGQEWHIVYRFASDQQLQRWEASPERARELERAEPWMDETGVQRVSGLETWFELPGRTAPAPPRRKMWAITMLAIFPLSLAFNALVGPHVGGLALPLRTLLFSGTLVTLMTWVVMPRMTRLFRGWLYGGGP
jgi:uncharacterized protein